MDAELIFWIVCVVVTVLALTFICKVTDKAEIDAMFRRPCENVDDMEDRWH